MDLRVERTKRSIVNAYIELRAKKPIEKITVKELAELAFINKATFYTHYHDIYNLAEQLEDEVIESVLKGIPHPDHIIKNPKRAVEELTDALLSKKSLTNIIFSGSREAIYAKKLEQGLKEHIYEQYPGYRENLVWDITLTMVIQGGFVAFMSHSDKDLGKVMGTIGDINQCLQEHFLV